MPKCPTIFIDRTFGSKKLAGELRKMGFRIKTHDSMFKKTEGDENWLLIIGQKNWRVFTADQEMESLHHLSIVAGNVGVFVLSDLKQGETYVQWVTMIKGCEARIRHACSFGKRPFVARISRLGTLYRVRHLKPHLKVEDITIETEQNAQALGITVGN